jgi:hypothetical protein
MNWLNNEELDRENIVISLNGNASKCYHPMLPSFAEGSLASSELHHAVHSGHVERFVTWSKHTASEPLVAMDGKSGVMRGG